MNHGVAWIGYIVVNSEVHAHMTGMEGGDGV